MSLLNSPDPAVRAAVVQQDLGNVLHPIVQHKALETKQMVVTRSEGSTIVDADGTEYLDGMAGLWCVISATGAANSPRSPPIRCGSSPIFRTPR